MAFHDRALREKGIKGAAPLGVVNEGALRQLNGGDIEIPDFSKPAKPSFVQRFNAAGQNIKPITLQPSPSNAFENARGPNPDNKPRLTPDDPAYWDSAEGIELAKTGYRNVSVKAAFTSGEDEDEEKEKEEKARLREITSQVLEYGGMKFSYQTVMHNLTAQREATDGYKMVNDRFIEVSDRDILRVDASGNIVDPADYPDGKYPPGVREVKTLEEKTALENKLGQNVAGLSQDEVACIEPEPGQKRCVRKENFYKGMELENKSAEIEQAKADIKSGKMKLEDMPEHLKAAVKQQEEIWRKGPEPDPSMNMMPKEETPSAAAPQAAPQMQAPLPQLRPLAPM
jgi:hypothetical protein